MRISGTKAAEKRMASRVGVAVGLAIGADPRDLALLGGEGLDGGDAAEVVGERAGEVADLVAHLAVARLQAALVEERAPEDHGDRREGDQGEQGRGDQEDDPDQRPR